jgi:ribosome-associated protein
MDEMHRPEVPQSGELASESGFHPAPGVFIPKSAVRQSFSRSSGPGGQNVNKVNTRAEVRVDVADIAGLSSAGHSRLRRLAGQRLTRAGEIVIVADSSRSQRMNREEALERLLALVAEAAREPKPRKKKKLTKAAKAKRVEAKRRLRKKKEQRRWREE